MVSARCVICMSSRREPRTYLERILLCDGCKYKLQDALDRLTYFGLALVDAMTGEVLVEALLDEDLSTKQSGGASASEVAPSEKPEEQSKAGRSSKST